MFVLVDIVGDDEYWSTMGGIGFRLELLGGRSSSRGWVLTVLGSVRVGILREIVSGSVPGEGSGRQLVSPDVAAPDTAPGPLSPLEEFEAMAAPAPELSQPPGPWAAPAVGPVLDDVEIINAPEDQLPTAGGTRVWLGGFHHHCSLFFLKVSSLVDCVGRRPLL